MAELTPTETKIVEVIRAQAEPTGEEDIRTKSELRREQRRLIAIIDRLVKT